MSKELVETTFPIDRALSLHPSTRDQLHFRKARREEFDRLVESSHCQLCASLAYVLRSCSPAMLFGSGQVEEIASVVKAQEIDVVFVDHLLSPVQQKNLEKALDLKVVDRTGLILEIFASRARTREGCLQVELASLNYQLGRLVRSWTHLERQRGGHGFLGGPGERQIELDRRMIRTQIKRLKIELAKVSRTRSTQRKGRKRRAVPTVALVGYTNAGKSTLFNTLTSADVYANDQLFATLDPTLREVALNNGQSLMLSDTVGFVQDLPHELVNAFRATLEEVVEADLILHVRDAADPHVVEQGEVVVQTLAQLGLDDDHAPPMIEIWNKVDLTTGVYSQINDPIANSRVAVSALTGEGIETLLLLFKNWLEQDMTLFNLRFSSADGKSLAFCHANGTVLDTCFSDESVQVQVKFREQSMAKLSQKDGFDYCLWD
ncbi:MAG: GTPase HflX [Mariprofundaceae bacterium]|nr:GTPase HflX [Mariprofundaceae bacterium]